MFLANDVDLRRIYERFANDLIYYVHADGSDEKVKLQLNSFFSDPSRNAHRAKTFTAAIAKLNNANATFFLS